jgi:hypothetical protein
MKVTLEPRGAMPDGQPTLGFVERDGLRFPLTYEHREACAILPDGALGPLPEEEFHEALVEDLERVCAPIWGGDWTKALAELAGVNPRSFARDRLRERGLPPDVLECVIELSREPDAAALAHTTRALARYCDMHRADPHDVAARAADRLRRFRNIPKDASYLNPGVQRLKSSW